MNRVFTESRRVGLHRGLALAAAAVIAADYALATQQLSAAGLAAQRDAMQKLAFLIGHWSGPATISRGPGNPLILTQSEDVQYKLDGLVLLIEGRGSGPDGRTQFQALATIAFDEASHTYRFRAYNDGHYINTELTVLADGFSWGMTAGPANIVNTMHLTSKGEWKESTEVTVGSNPPRHSVDMLLQRQP